LTSIAGYGRLQFVRTVRGEAGLVRCHHNPDSSHAENNPTASYSSPLDLDDFSGIPTCRCIRIVMFVVSTLPSGAPSREC